MKLQARGSMLVLALWALSLLTVFSISLGFSVRQKASLLNRLATLDALYPVAYSGVELAKSLVKADDNVDVDLRGDTWAQPVEGDISGASLVLATEGSPAVVDEERKLNLNNARIDIASRLFQRVSGLPKEQADELVYNVIDFMDSDSFYGHPQYGAENSYYDSLQKPYKCKDAEYEQLDELLLVKGMTQNTFAALKPYITVYGSGKVNMNTAGEEVLSALGFTPDAVKAILVLREGSDGRPGTSDDNFFMNAQQIASDIAAKTGTPLDVSQEVLLSGLVTEGRIGVSSTMFRVRSTASLEKSGASLSVEAVFDRKAQVVYQRAGEIAWPARA
jgi:general secretion pathway protein K